MAPYDDNDMRRNEELARKLVAQREREKEEQRQREEAQKKEKDR